ncbi:MAG: glycosyltransferase family 4 protein [Chloroflexia bacterium]|nr:glycosyltransferase family 4 protein [Chloroflexia bacterium]
MKILQVHNFYKQSGGEDSVVKNEYDLLIKYGHEVIQHTKHNDEIIGWRSKIDVAFNTHYSKKTYNDFKSVLLNTKPDIVHVHNLFPLFTPSIFDACLECKTPVVMTIHNFRIFYPNGLFLHNGKLDMRGLKTSAYRCVFDKVYRDSFIQTAVVAHMIEFHKRKNTWNKNTTTLIALSELSRQILIEGGIWDEKLVIKPNFCEDRYDISEVKNELLSKKYIVFVGRISEEKGIIQLIEHYKYLDIKTPLFIIGDGPLKDKLLQETKDNTLLHWMGSQSHHETLNYIRNAQALIFPSICLENFPMTIVESLSLGVPVLASNIGAAKYIIQDTKEGILYDPFNKQEFYDSLQVILKPDVNKQMSSNARQRYLLNFTPELNYQTLISIYNDSITKNTKHQD